MSLMFSPKDPTEVIGLGISFINILNLGESIVSGFYTATDTETGADATSQIISGAAQISGPALLQLVHNGVNGNSYLLTATINTSLSYVRVGSATLPIITGA